MKKTRACVRDPPDGPLTSMRAKADAQIDPSARRVAGSCAAGGIVKSGASQIKTCSGGDLPTHAARTVDDAREGGGDVAAVAAGGEGAQAQQVEERQRSGTGSRLEAQDS